MEVSMMPLSRATVLAGAVLVAATATAQVVQVDASIPSYQRTVTVSGNLSAVGSDTMNNMMTLWSEGFARIHPSVKIQVEGKGSSTAPPALIAGSAQLGPMSREMKDSEIDAVQAKYGFAPTQIVTAIDTIGIYVNKDNPLKSISLAEVDAIFSKTRKRNYPTDLTT
jgi:phosphate transport system substrate-binding protein